MPALAPFAAFLHLVVAKAWIRDCWYIDSIGGVERARQMFAACEAYHHDLQIATGVLR